MSKLSTHFTKRGFTHFDKLGHAIMVDVSSKPMTKRIAMAVGYVRMTPTTLNTVMKGMAKKGDVLGVARIAGIMAAKRTADIIPLCHALPLQAIRIEFNCDQDNALIQIESLVTTYGRTGVEMEALTAVSVAALTIYDMVKSIDRGIVLSDIRLLQKAGGASGDFNAGEE